jgi:hypothetical protein
VVRRFIVPSAPAGSTAAIMKITFPPLLHRQGSESTTVPSFRTMAPLLPATAGDFLGGPVTPFPAGPDTSGGSNGASSHAYVLVGAVPPLVDGTGGFAATVSDDGDNVGQTKHARRCGDCRATMQCELLDRLWLCHWCYVIQPPGDAVLCADCGKFACAGCAGHLAVGD